MFNTWVFGDSFSNGYGYIDDGNYNYYEEWHKRYIKYKKESDDIWPNFLAKKLNCNLKNYAVGGYSNDKILDSILENIHSFNKEDIVIISRTFNARFDIPDLKSSKFFKTIHGERLSLIKDSIEVTYDIKDRLEQETILNFGLIFMDNILYKKRNDLRFESLKKIIDKLVHKTILWDVDSNFRKSFETIAQHTKNKINDYHFSYNAHMQISEYFYTKIIGSKSLL